MIAVFVLYISIAGNATHIGTFETLKECQDGFKQMRAHVFSGGAWRETEIDAGVCLAIKRNRRGLRFTP